MTVELVSIKKGHWNGNTDYADLQFLAEKCVELGLEIGYQTMVDHNPQRISRVLDAALERSEVVLVHGGSVKEYRPKQSLVLSGGEQGEDGFIAEQNGKILILLPKDRSAMRLMFTEQVYPYLQASRRAVCYTRVAKICGMEENEVKEKLADLMTGQKNLSFDIDTKLGEVHIRIAGTAENEETAKQLVKPVVKKIKQRLGDFVYATKEKTTLEKAVVRLLKKYDLKVTTAESCTAGLLAGRLVNVPGASDVFKEGFITYSNKAKRKYLDVDKNTLKKYTAVSEETAKEMAIGGAFAADRDVCVAVTGLAGPDGGTDEKPVGLVYIAVYVKDSVRVREYHFKGTREEIRQRAVLEALDLLRRTILENDQLCGSVENNG